MNTDALLVIECIETELYKGTKHYSLDGKLLNTPLEICKALLKDKSIRIEPKEKEM